jgi:hypothetical protein
MNGGIKNDWVDKHLRVQGEADPKTSMRIPDETLRMQVSREM